MKKIKKKYTLEEILQEVISAGTPKVITELGTRLHVEEAEELCALLAVEGMDVEPYDFPNTMEVWRNEAYKFKATKTLIQRLATEQGVDYRTVEGFKQILPSLTARTFSKTPINQWRTTLRGMCLRSYGDSPSRPVLDLVETDDDFLAIRITGLRAYDFPKASQNMWVAKDGTRTAICRTATNELLLALARNHGIDPATREGFKVILPYLTTRIFQTYSINVWGTRLKGMLSRAYVSSPGAAVFDVIHNDEVFSAIQDIEPYDFPCAPNRTWVTKEGLPSDASRRATKRLISTIADQRGVDYRTVEGFRSLLPQLTLETFDATIINEWGTTLESMFVNAYQRSPSHAVIDLVNNDNDFLAIRAVGVQPYDFTRTTNLFFVDKEGTPSSACIEATKRLVQRLAQAKNVDYRTFNGFREILPLFTRDTFLHIPINDWGTTLVGVMCAYDFSPSAAVLALVARDDEFKEVRDLQPYDFLMAPRYTWTNVQGMPTDTARKATKLLIQRLTVEMGMECASPPQAITSLLPLRIKGLFKTTPINRWGTTLAGMLKSAYRGLPLAAVCDLINYDDDYMPLRGKIDWSDIGGGSRS